MEPPLGGRGLSESARLHQTICNTSDMSTRAWRATGQPPPRSSTRSALLSVAVPALLLVFVTGCSVSELAGGSVTKEEARAQVIDHWLQRSQSVDAYYPEDNLADLLPNHLFTVDGGKARPLASGIVVGQVHAVEPGAGFHSPSDQPKSEQIPYDDQRADWRSVTVTIRPDRTWGDLPRGDVRVGLAVSASIDPDIAVKGIGALRRIVVVLDPPGFFTNDPSLYRVRQSGALLGTVDDDDAISLPLAEDPEAFLGRLTTLTALQAAIAKPSTVEPMPGTQ